MGIAGSQANRPAALSEALLRPRLRTADDVLRSKQSILTRIETIILVTRIIRLGATVASFAILAPITIGAPIVISPSVAAVGPVIASGAVGRFQPRAIIMPVTLLVPSTVLIGLLFQASRVVGIQDIVNTANHVIRL